MKLLLLSVFVIFNFTTYAANDFDNDFENDIHPRCPFKYYQNVDKQALCMAYDNEMGQCQGESQVECSAEAFEKTVQRFNVKNQDIDFKDIDNSFDEEKKIDDAQFKGCSFAESDKKIICKDGRVYNLQTTAINDSSRQINKKLESSKDGQKKNKKPISVIKK